MAVEVQGVDDTALVTIVGAAQYLSISRGAVYHLLQVGELRSIHIGRARRIPLGELRSFVTAARDAASCLQALPTWDEPRIGTSADAVTGA